MFNLFRRNSEQHRHSLHNEHSARQYPTASQRRKSQTWSFGSCHYSKDSDSVTLNTGTCQKMDDESLVPSGDDALEETQSLTSGHGSLTQSSSGTSGLSRLIDVCNGAEQSRASYVAEWAVSTEEVEDSQITITPTAPSLPPLPAQQDDNNDISPTSGSVNPTATSPTPPVTGTGGIDVTSGGEVSEDEEAELFPASVLHTPVAALQKSGKRLCLKLNVEQPLLDQYTPDYIGLAMMLGFTTSEIHNFWAGNPTHTLLTEWGRRRDSRLLAPVLGTLVYCLEKLGRRDILEECHGLILADAISHMAAGHLSRIYTIGRRRTFDCYINIADDDLLTVGREIMVVVEKVYGLKLCLNLRDGIVGGFLYEEMAKMLETRCRSKCLIVLTRNYEHSDACYFLTQFAVTLDPRAQKRKLIPLLVDEDTNIPRVLRPLTTLHFRDRDRNLWPRLIAAIRQ